MGIKQSEANKKYWANIPAAVRSQRMQKIIKIRYAKMSEADRKKIGERLARGRALAAQRKLNS